MLAAKKLDSVGIHAYSVVGGIMFYKGYLENDFGHKRNERVAVDIDISVEH